MKKAIPFTVVGKLLLGSLLGAPSTTVTFAPSLHAENLLRAIAQVETGTTNLSRACRKVGQAGERSAWQLTAADWRRQTRAPFAAASEDPVVAHVVANLHLLYLTVRLQNQRRPVNAYTLACAWNAGPSARRPPSEYAERVTNIYHSLPQ